jgi:hypothetical protein
VEGLTVHKSAGHYAVELGEDLAASTDGRLDAERRESTSDLRLLCKIRPESWDQVEAWCTAQDDSPQTRLVLAAKEVAIELSSCSFRHGQASIRSLQIS